ncbi:hypothetical protein GE09DRAFT_1055061 [Coniochaeta sp. 2T2.1]|nr:hypothetical protein GE09DRAFT_1055061 [Coniochaeta sp. 2T2.1]
MVANSSVNPSMGMGGITVNIIPETPRRILDASINEDFATNCVMGRPQNPPMTVTIEPVNAPQSWDLVAGSEARAYLCRGTPCRPATLPDEYVKAGIGEKLHEVPPHAAFRYVAKYVWNPEDLIINDAGEFFYWVEIWTAGDSTTPSRKIVELVSHPITTHLTVTKLWEANTRALQ